MEDGSVGTVTPADFGITIRDFTCDIGICCRRSVDDIPRIHGPHDKKDAFNANLAR